MAYTPTTWASGDTITAAKLNKLEQGVAEGGALILTVDDWTANIPTISQSWNDIVTAMANNKLVYVNYPSYTDGNITTVGIFLIVSAIIEENKYFIYGNYDFEVAFAQADTPNEPMSILYF